MKKIFFALILSLLPFSFAQAQSVSGSGYTLTATPKDYVADIVVDRPSAASYPLATYSGFAVNIPIGAIGIASPRLDKNFPQLPNELAATSNVLFKGSSGVQLSKAIFTPNLLTPGKTYYTQVVIKTAAGFSYIGPVLEFKTTEPAALSVKGPTVTIEKDKQDFKTFVVRGGVDTSKHGDPQNFSVKVEVSQNASFDTILSSSPDYVTIDTTTGTYEWIERVNSMSIDREYDVRQTITYKPTGKSQVSLGKFNVKTGTTPLPSSVAASNFKKKSYEFLAPLPGFKYFYDPDLCAEKSETDKTVICDINDLLNFLFKFMIGLAAVMLVIRLMIEGYTYLVSDIPGVKGSAKSHMMEAVMGLLLALTAYIILNTVNPKLVNNTVSLQKTTGFNIEVFESLDGEGQSTIDGKVIKVSKSKINYEKNYSNTTACAGQGGTKNAPSPATCTKYSADITTDASGKYLEASFATKLTAFQQKLKEKNIPWKITEAWPESRSHKAICHQIGVCIDMNHTTAWGSTTPNSSPTVAQIKTVIETAASLNMCAQYEILKDSDLNNRLANAGLGKNVIYFGGKWISANHYSLYNGTCK